VDVADASLLDVAHRALEVRAGALLGPHLDDAVVPARGVDHQASIPDMVRDGFLDVDVLAGVAGVDAHDRVPVFRRRDDDGVEVPVLEQTPVVGYRLRPPVGQGDGALHRRLRHVAHGHDVGVRVAQELPQVDRPEIADPDHADADPIARRRATSAVCRGGAGLAGGGRERIAGYQAGQHGRLEKISPLHSASLPEGSRLRSCCARRRHGAGSGAVVTAARLFRRGLLD
jgi:hypothetical protein